MAAVLMADSGGAMVAHLSFLATACLGELGYSVLVVQQRCRVRLELRWSSGEAWPHAWWRSSAQSMMVVSPFR